MGGRRDPHIQKYKSGLVLNLGEGLGSSFRREISEKLLQALVSNIMSPNGRGHRIEISELSCIVCGPCCFQTIFPTAHFDSRPMHLA